MLRCITFECFFFHVLCCPIEPWYMLRNDVGILDALAHSTLVRIAVGASGYGTTNTGYGTTNVDAGVGIGMKRAEFDFFTKKNH